MSTPHLGRILLVEDDPDIQAVAQLALVAVGGFQVRICGSGQEALASGPDFGPDLILLDVMMPEMDGPATLSALRRLPQTSATPVIFMTAKAQRHEIAAYQSLGAIGVITKPFDPMTLSSTLVQIWKAHHERRAD